MIAIEMIGAVYCPLSPRDPQHRLYALVRQTRTRALLVHGLTATKFNKDIISIDLDLILTNVANKDMGKCDTLSCIKVTPNHIAYIIFTSGSTGIPKAVG